MHIDGIALDQPGHRGRVLGPWREGVAVVLPPQLEDRVGRVDEEDRARLLHHRCAAPAIRFRDLGREVEIGFTPEQVAREVERCLNCDVQTVFTGTLCIECDACVDICPMDCITFTENGEEKDLRLRLMAPAMNPTQDLYVGNDLKTGRIMVKDEDVCLHCGLCAERCPTGAWDMRKYYMEMTHAEHACRKQ